jgi:hypothetical protein
MMTKELQQLWWDWLGTSERLLRSLHEQTAALTLRDVARVEKIQPELDSLLTSMKTIDDRAVTCAKKLAGELGTEPNLRSLVRVLEKTEAQQVQSIANRVTVAARHVNAVLHRNRTLLESELVYINGTLTLMAKTATESKGKFAVVSQAAVLMDATA